MNVFKENKNIGKKTYPIFGNDQVVNAYLRNVMGFDESFSEHINLLSLRNRVWPEPEKHYGEIRSILGVDVSINRKFIIAIKRLYFLVHMNRFIERNLYELICEPNKISKEDLKYYYAEPYLKLIPLPLYGFVCNFQCNCELYEGVSYQETSITVETAKKFLENLLKKNLVVRNKLKHTWHGNAKHYSLTSDCVAKIKQCSDIIVELDKYETLENL